MAEKIQPKEGRRWKNAIMQILSERGFTQSEASRSIGHKSSALAQYLSNRYDRPTPEILAGIVGYWEEHEYVRVLIAHLYDEIERVNLNPNRFTIAHFVNDISKATDIQAIERAAAASQGWAELAAALGTVARNDARHGYPAGTVMAANMAKVAESPAAYAQPKKFRKPKG